MKERERLSWSILLIAFACFLALAVGIPVGGYQWVQRATVDPTMRLQTLSGNAQIEQPGAAPRLLLARQEPIDIRPGAVIINDAQTEALLTISSPERGDSLGSVQIYPHTELEVSVATSPRYHFSQAGHRIEVMVSAGRARLNLSRDTDRAVDLRSHTPHAQFLLWEAGSYHLEVDEEQSQITVRDGKATIIAPNGQLSLDERERGAVALGTPPQGPLPPVRDLIDNGHFAQALEPSWEVRSDSADSSQSAGAAEPVISDQTAVRLSRAGSGHAKTGIYQLVNESLLNYSWLQLHISAQLNYQNLGICGAMGSECPLMVRIDYLDSFGHLRHWVQGFYYLVTSPDSNPTVCEACPPPRQQHEQHAQGSQFFFDSPNLMTLLAQDGQHPVGIVSIEVYASGHSYDVLVSEVELLVDE